MRPFLKKILLRASVLLGINSLLGYFLPRRGYLVGYHSIKASETDTFEQWRYPHVTITADTLKKELAYLERKGHTFVSLYGLLEAVKKGVRKPTVIYFDDGYKDTLEIALPILRSKNIPAAVFLVTDLLGGLKKNLPGFKTSDDATFTPFLDWEGAKELAYKGVTIGSHTVTHSKLIYCSDAELERELIESKHLLEEKLGIPIDTISYPHGRADQRVANAAKKAGYVLGLTTAEGINSVQSIEKSPLLLYKVEPRPEDTFLDFQAKVYSAGVLASLRNK